MEANARLLLKQMPNGHQFRITGNGRIVEKRNVLNRLASGIGHEQYEQTEPRMYRHDAYNTYELNDEGLEAAGDTEEEEPQPGPSNYVPTSKNRSK
jgi:hypothetical protein